MVGGDYIPRNLDCLAEEGRQVSIAVQRGAQAEIRYGRVMAGASRSPARRCAPAPPRFKAALADEIAREVWPLGRGGDCGR